jgi:hypothetical protein
MRPSQNLRNVPFPITLGNRGMGFTGVKQSVTGRSRIGSSITFDFQEISHHTIGARSSC